MNNTGTFSGTVLWSTDTPSGKGCSLDTTNGYATITENGSLDLPNELTISVWLKPMTETSGYAVHPVIKMASTVEANYALYFAGNFGGATPWPSRSVSLYATVDGTWISVTPWGTYKIELEKWTHIVMTYSSTNGSQLYLNGKLAYNTSSVTGALTTTNANLRLGGTSPANGGSFPGLMDDVRIYKRALTASEINRIYAEGAGSQTIADGIEYRK